MLHVSGVFGVVNFGADPEVASAHDSGFMWTAPVASTPGRSATAGRPAGRDGYTDRAAEEKRAIVAAAERDDNARTVAEYIRSVLFDKLGFVPRHP